MEQFYVRFAEPALVEALADTPVVLLFPGFTDALISDRPAIEPVMDFTVRDVP